MSERIIAVVEEILGTSREELAKLSFKKDAGSLLWELPKNSLDLLGLHLINCHPKLDLINWVYNLDQVLPQVGVIPRVFSPTLLPLVTPSHGVSPTGGIAGLHLVSAGTGCQGVAGWCHVLPTESWQPGTKVHLVKTKWQKINLIACTSRCTPALACQQAGCSSPSPLPPWNQKRSVRGETHAYFFFSARHLEKKFGRPRLGKNISDVGTIMLIPPWMF